MQTRNFRTASAVAALALFTFRAVAQTPTTESQILMTFCLAHPEACSISIDYARNGKEWHIDYNGERLNPIASTIKVVHLMTYADAVEHHKIEPGEAVPSTNGPSFGSGGMAERWRRPTPRTAARSR